LKQDLKDGLSKLFENKNFEDVMRGYVEVDIEDPKLLDELADNAFEYGIDALEEAVTEKVNGEIEINLVLPDEYLRRIGELSADDMGKLVKVRGLINMMGNIRPRCELAVFRCRRCEQNTPPVPQTNPFLLIPPFECPNPPLTGRRRKCGGRIFDLVPEASTMISTQEYMIQELPEDIRRQTPAFIKLLILKKSLIRKVQCGDKVEIVGVVRAIHTQKRDRYTDLFIEVSNVIRKKKDVEFTTLLSEDVNEIKALSEDPALYGKLVNTIAPSLHDMTLEKEACLLSIFSGVEKKRSDITRRGSIHVLLVGDPSTGKSQLLRAVTNLAPSAMYSSGKGTTAAGLTAAVLRKGKSGDNWIISAGVMVLADKGIACIDEIDKMSNEDRVAIHEAMEQQTVTIDKANIHAMLPAKTTVISAANPSFGRYNIYKTIAENIKNLPVTLLSRFDIIFILRDVPDKIKDEAMAKHIMELEKIEGIIDRDLVKKYIIYAKRLTPKLTKEVANFLMEKFLALRERQKEEDPIPITARQFESLIRLSEAHARVFLRTEIHIEDAEAAIRILMESLKQTCFDVETGKQDIDMTEAGRPKSQSDKMLKLLDIIKALSRQLGGMAFIDDIIVEAKEQGMSEADVQKFIVKLINDGSIFNPREGYYKATR